MRVFTINLVVALTVISYLLTDVGLNAELVDSICVANTIEENVDDPETDRICVCDHEANLRCHSTKELNQRTRDMCALTKAMGPFQRGCNECLCWNDGRVFCTLERCKTRPRVCNIETETFVIDDEVCECDRHSGVLCRPK
jgi:hypothetical protein